MKKKVEKRVTKAQRDKREMQRQEKHCRYEEDMNALGHSITSLLVYVWA